MKINVVNTERGLVPETDMDFEQKRHLEMGRTYLVEIKTFRSPQFHRKYFKMIRTAFEFLPENLQDFFGDEHGFRKTTEMAAGYFESVYSPRLQEWVEVPKSIAYDALSQEDYEDLYLKVRRILDTLLSKYITREQFEEAFLNF